MTQHLLENSMARVIRFASSNDAIRRMLDRSSLKPSLNRTLFRSLRLINRGVFEGDINGVKTLFYDPGGPNSYWISFYTGLLYEHSVVMHLKQITKQHDSPIFLDVGAHYGYYTIYMSGLGGPSSKVFSFEPNSYYFKVLSTNVRLNELQNVVLHRVALSDKKGTVILETSRRYRSKGFFLEKRKMRSVDALNCPIDGDVLAIPFDELAHTAGISPDIVKIDVHGAEGNVINGMKKTFKKSVSHLYCELHDEMCDGYSARDVVNMLQDVGMEIFEFRGFRDRDGRLTEISDDLFSANSRMIYARK